MTPAGGRGECEIPPMGKIYALLVAVNDYPPPTPRLAGCLNDIEEVGSWLAGRGVAGDATRRLTDGAATVEAVTDGIRTHLAQAGQGDTALLWFSGHGTELDVEAGSGYSLIEATGKYQALVCADGSLIDKELGALLDAIGDGGAQVTAVLDCCYAGGGTRDREPGTRYAPPLAAWTSARPLPAGFTVATAATVAPRSVAPAQGPPYVPRHVLLAACRLDEQAREHDFDGAQHGVFTRALLASVRVAGPGATHRELLSAAQARVRTERIAQHPVLYPHEPGGPADRPFMGGPEGGGAVAPYLLRSGKDGWEVDCGSAHGLRDSEGEVPAAEFTVLAVPTDLRTGPGAGPATAHPQGVRPTDSRTPWVSRTPSTSRTPWTLRTRTVEPERSLVTPEGWAPDAERIYPVELSALALPPVSFSVEMAPPGGSTAPVAGTAPLTRTAAPSARTETVARAAVRAVLDAIATAGPDGRPAPLLRQVEHPGTGTGRSPMLRVVITAGPGGGARAEVVHRDGTSAVAPLPLADLAEDARRVADCLLHLARWRRLRDLETPMSPLNSSVGVDIVPVGAEDPIVPDGAGEIVCRYEKDEGGRWREPAVRIRIRNRSPFAQLWCVLLDLTDSYESHSFLYPGHFIGPRGTGHALDGDVVRLFLPPSRPVRPGSQVRDWLKLIVAEGEMNTVPFHLERWDQCSSHASRRAAAHTNEGADGLLRIGPPLSPSSPSPLSSLSSTASPHSPFAQSRDLGPSAGGGGPGRWAALTIPMRTVVPHTNGNEGE